MSFESEYEAFIARHKEKRTGKKLRRVQEGHGHAEKLFLETVWWPAIGHFDHLQRQNHPVIEGWKVIRFAYDDLLEKPRRCQQLVQQLLGKWFGGERIAPMPELTARHKEIVRAAIRKGAPVTPADVCRELQISDRHARDLLRRLMEIEVLLPASGTKRIRSYRLNIAGKPLYL